MSAQTDASTAQPVAERREWQGEWPLRTAGLLVLAKGGAAMLAIWTAVGLLFVLVLEDGPIGDADRAATEWLAERRTDMWDSASHVGSMLSDTMVKVTLVAVVGGAMVLVWRRWYEGVFLAVVVAFEATIFVTSSLIVDRDRPPVEPLDPPAASGSFPSGHTAAAVAFYGGVYVIVRWHTTNRAVRSTFAVIAVVVPLVVASSRVYRGMHHPIDVVAGLLLGLASIVVVMAAMEASNPTSSPRRQQ